MKSEAPPRVVLEGRSSLSLSFEGVSASGELVCGRKKVIRILSLPRARWDKGPVGVGVGGNKDALPTDDDKAILRFLFKV